MSTQYYLYFCDSEDRAATEKKINSCFSDAGMQGRLVLEHRSQDEFIGEDAWANMIHEEYGFLPDWESKVTPDKHRIAKSNIAFVHFLNRMMSSVSGDILVLCGADLPMLMRINGKLAVKNEESAWDGSMLALLMR